VVRKSLEEGENVRPPQCPAWPEVLEAVGAGVSIADLRPAFASRSNRATVNSKKALYAARVTSTARGSVNRQTARATNEVEIPDSAGFREVPSPMQRPRIGVFACIYPDRQFHGPDSTGMVYLLHRAGTFGHIEVFPQSGGHFPPILGIEATLDGPGWRQDHPISILRTGLKMCRRASRLDGYVFNLALTAFGRKPVANVTGLLTPVMVARLTRRPTVVYMHNFLESQDTERLGYRVTTLQRLVVRFIERRIGKNTHLVAPLDSQRRIVSKDLGIPLTSFSLPFADGIFPALLYCASPAPAESRETPGELRVLLFGSWGPQKDLENALKMLARLQEKGIPIHVTLAGRVSPHFPEFRSRVQALVARLDPTWFRYVPEVADEDVPGLFASADVVFLPYHASGGASGVMNIAAAFGCLIVAYDLPDLREFNEVLDAGAQFIPPGDEEALMGALQRAQESVQVKSRAAVTKRLDRASRLAARFWSDSTAGASG
jgi:glycosyltransferase involved in cell wall biosynthesis